MTTSNHFRIAGGGSGTPELQPDGTLIVRGAKVFRVGSFRDHRGTATEWTHADLNAAVANFNLLGQHELPNIPVRKDHSRTIDAVGGYISNLYVSGDYLMADYSLLAADDVAKYQRGLYRSVSLEIGSYRSNDDTVHSPVVMGLALVDLPAVEGLFTLHQEESQMFTQAELDWAVAATYAAGVAALEEKPADEAVINHALAIGYAQADLDVRAEFAAKDDNFEPFHFALPDGESTADYAKVQATITSQAGALTEQRNLARSQFVKDLAEDGKITAPMVPSMTTHVLGLTQEAFTAYVEMYAAAPKLPVLGGHGGGDNPPGDGTVKTDRIATLEMQVSMHRNAGVKDEQLHQLPSWIELQALKTQEV